MMLDAERKDTDAEGHLDDDSLRQENNRYRGTTGISEECRGRGFLPAFRDTDTGEIYLSCFADGKPAPFHTLDGLPDSVIRTRLADGTVESVKPGIQSGFVKAGVFYTRDQAVLSLSARNAE